MSRHLSDEEFLVQWVLAHGGDAPSAERIRIYRALAAHLPAEDLRARLFSLADELARIDRQVHQLSLQLLFTTEK